jgi:hypothetical protein
MRNSIYIKRKFADLFHLTLQVRYDYKTNMMMDTCPLLSDAIKFSKEYDLDEEKTIMKYLDEAHYQMKEETFKIPKYHNGRLTA